MKKEKDILKLFGGDITLAELQQLYPNDDFSYLEKTMFYTKQINVPKIDAELALQKLKARNLVKTSPKVIPLYRRNFMRIAAAITILLGLSVVFLFNSKAKHYTTDIAQIKTINLPDNSEVILNSKSDLSYHVKTWKSNRSLEFNGEAFFKVSKGNTFTVNTIAGKVEVLGTQFNVKNRPNFFEVQCYEGAVRVTSGLEVVELTPGNTFRMELGKITSVQPFYNINEPYWLNKESSFENVPLWQVINELKVQYDIEVVTQAVNTTELFTGTFTHTNLNKALQSVTIPLNLNFEIDGKRVKLYNYVQK